MGLSTPAWDRRVVAQYQLTPVWNAFIDLDRERGRTNTGSHAAIHSRDVKAWLWIHGVTDIEVRIWFYQLITKMDALMVDKLNNPRELEPKITKKRK